MFWVCHTDKGGISVFIKTLSGRDVSFVDMTAGDNPDNYREIVETANFIAFYKNTKGAQVLNLCAFYELVECTTLLLNRLYFTIILLKVVLSPSVILIK